MIKDNHHGNAPAIASKAQDAIVGCISESIAGAVRQLLPVSSLFPLFFTANQERLGAAQARIAEIDAELAELARRERSAAHGLITAAGLPLTNAPNDDGLFTLLNGGRVS